MKIDVTINDVTGERVQTLLEYYEGYTKTDLVELAIDRLFGQYLDERKKDLP